MATKKYSRKSFPLKKVRPAASETANGPINHTAEKNDTKLGGVGKHNNKQTTTKTTMTTTGKVAVGQRAPMIPNGPDL